MNKRFLHTLASAGLLLTACSAKGPNDSHNPNGKADGVGAAACLGFIQDASGLGRSAEEIAAHQDAIGQFVLTAGSTCPLSFKDIMAKLAQTDNAGCLSAPVQAVVVSETAQLGGDKKYRAIVTRTCGGREQEDLFMSPPAPIGVSGAPPEAVEIIAKDTTSGVFNYYAAENGAWRFMGNSLDLVQNGTGSGDERRCAACHPDGALNMKELHTPWNNWEGVTTTPGADQAVTNLLTSLGVQNVSVANNKFNGSAMEGLVTLGNIAYNQKRLELLKTQGAAAVLKPLFCTVQFNLEEGQGFYPGIFFLDASLNGPFVSAPSYHKTIQAIGQKVVDDNGNQIGTDTKFSFTFPAKSESTRSYLQALSAAGIIDQSFITAVNGVNLTDPLFNAARCDLLKDAPTSGDLTAAAITAGFISNLQALSQPTDAEKQLLANLQNPASVTAKAQAFSAACQNRGKNDADAFSADVLRVASIRRQQLRQLPIVEHRPLLPEDNLGTSDADTQRFDSTTCKLTQ